MKSGIKFLLLFGLLAGWSTPGECAGMVVEKGSIVYGKTGYSVQLPKGYTGASNVMSNGIEIVAAWPFKNKVKFTDIGDIKKVKAQKIIVLRVYPQPRFTRTMSDYAAQILRKLEDDGDGVVWSEQKFPAGKAVVIQNTIQPTFTRLLIEGKNNLFEFTTDELSDALVDMCKTLKEGPRTGQDKSETKK
jgi:hypothetical protein